jgi:hypothetical protein
MSLDSDLLAENAVNVKSAGKHLMEVADDLLVAANELQDSHNELDVLREALEYGARSGGLSAGECAFTLNGIAAAKSERAELLKQIREETHASP